MTPFRKKTRRSRKSKNKLQLYKIKRLEDNMLEQFTEIVEPLQPTLIFHKYNMSRDRYDMDGVELKGFINTYHVLNVQLHAGIIGTELVRNITIKPITSDDFDDNYSEAMKRHESGQPYDPAHTACYQHINTLVGSYQMLFKEEFNKPHPSPKLKSKTIIPFYQRQSDEFRAYHYYQKRDMDLLNEEPYPQEYSASLDFQNKRSLKRNKRHIQTALFWFASKADLIEPQYHDVIYKYDGVNQFSL